MLTLLCFFSTSNHFFKNCLKHKRMHKGCWRNGAGGVLPEDRAWRIQLSVSQHNNTHENITSTSVNIVSEHLPQQRGGARRFGDLRAARASRPTPSSCKITTATGKKNTHTLRSLLRYSSYAISSGTICIHANGPSLPPTWTCKVGRSVLISWPKSLTCNSGFHQSLVRI